jgi:peptide deformylase
MKITLCLLLLFSTSAWATKLEIIKLGHPTLRLEAQELQLAEIESPENQKLIDDMVETMAKSQGVGLAAPQVNKSLRMFVMKSWPGVPLTIVINPKIEYLEEYGKKSSTEGCLSIPGKTLTVQRYKRIHLSYFDRSGEFQSQELTGMGAIIAQHEYDHLNGVMIVDLVENFFSEMVGKNLSSAPLM